MTRTVRGALEDAVRQGLPRSEAQWLLTRVLDRSRAWLLAHDDAELDAQALQRWQAWLAGRLDDVPLAYLTGHKEFHGLPLQVTPAVLDPRPDTETLVDWALERLAEQPAGARVLDLGTGSGAIALALKHRRPDALVTAVDSSKAALAVARVNGTRLGLDVDWRHGHWFAPVAGERFDLIVSNPPYLAENDPHLPALRHEPRQALTAGPDGLRDLRELVANAADHLRPQGWLLLEHGYDQAAAVAQLMAASDSRWGPCVHRQDLAGHLRCSGAARRP
jgi:release factor glutamine methyltransferase